MKANTVIAVLSSLTLSPFSRGDSLGGSGALKYRRVRDWSEIPRWTLRWCRVARAPACPARETFHTTRNPVVTAVFVCRCFGRFMLAQKSRAHEKSPDHFNPRCSRPAYSPQHHSTSPSDPHFRPLAPRQRCSRPATLRQERATFTLLRFSVGKRVNSSKPAVCAC